MVDPNRPNGFPTAALLADHDAQAAELRHDLDELRRQLDDGPPPLSPVRKRRRRPLLGALVVGGTLGAIATATLIPWSDLGRPGGTAQLTTGTPTTARPVTRNPPVLAPRAAPAGSLPATGPGITDPGTMMVVQIGQAGVLDVTEQAVLGSAGLREVQLALPSMASLGGAVAELRPTVRNLRAAVNGTPAAITPNPDGSGWTVSTAEPARTVQLSYQISDTIVRSRPSAAGRALAISLPLLGQTLREQGLPLVSRIEGTQIAGVTCPGADATEMLCGTQLDNGWSATVPASASSPVLLLQLNLKN
jgi:hypothetical protein